MDTKKFIEKIKSVLVDPQKFFKQLKKEKGLRPAFVYFTITLAVGMLRSAIINFIMQGAISAFAGPGITLSTFAIFAISIIGFMLALPMSFLGAGILHIWIILFGGKAKYEKSYQLMVYSGTPSRLFSWIPVVGYFLWIYDLVLLVIGVQKTHKVNFPKALLIALLPVVLVIMAVIIIIVFGISAYMLSA